MKRRILEVDLARKKSASLTGPEREAQDRARGVVERADLLKMEQEEEIRMLNTVRRGSFQQLLQMFCSNVQQHYVCSWFLQLILDAQCQATRDAQIQEKKQMRAELTEEEKRLDAMMEAERRRALETDKKTDELCKEQRRR